MWSCCSDSAHGAASIATFRDTRGAQIPGSVNLAGHTLPPRFLPPQEWLAGAPLKTNGRWCRLTCKASSPASPRSKPMFRTDGRPNDRPRDVTITPSYLVFPEGSALIEVGETKVVCTASLEERVPPWLRGQGKGWITAEYNMLPRSTLTRTQREREAGRVSGRTLEIQRLIGRSLRAVADMGAMGERTITIDCDVLQADGGTRTASITGAYIAMYQAMQYMVKTGALRSIPLKGAVAAISVGLVDNELALDLCYDEDSRAEVDFNVVMTDAGEFVEVQGTAEGSPFSRDAMDDLLSLAGRGIQHHFEAQQAGNQVPLSLGQTAFIQASRESRWRDSVTR